MDQEGIVGADGYNFFDTFPTLQIGKFRLRELSKVDSDDYFEMMSHHLVTKYIADEDVPKTVQEAQDEIRFWQSLFHEKRTIFWGITQLLNHKLIGTVGYNYWSRSTKTAEISYDLCYEYWGRGIMSEILRNVVKFGFDRMSLDQIEAKTVHDNIASQKVLTKIGFKLGDVLPKHRIIKSVPTDVYTYHLMRSNFTYDNVI
ncbi:N-acetyltransferase [Rickettsiales endosymbiont of Peranema trichophorum]|uniref:GNAT family N-acetyltransferase n=1 Tax=Rickettsiales endosymbiont of Peranema trichophorum TaxID=2486577 RepID=UPI001023AC70|nr:GNAT family protein [Rickettsiales endosymbiont of Peranema trichophorum]RZI47460.1 N-acetyltransferase [Rickettsiales endosymbiont of Peranema trichophorum]